MSGSILEGSQLIKPSKYLVHGSSDIIGTWLTHLGNEKLFNCFGEW